MPKAEWGGVGRPRFAENSCDPCEGKRAREVSRWTHRSPRSSGHRPPERTLALRAPWWHGPFDSVSPDEGEEVRHVEERRNGAPMRPVMTPTKRYPNQDYSLNIYGACAKKR